MCVAPGPPLCLPLTALISRRHRRFLYKMLYISMFRLASDSILCQNQGPVIVCIMIAGGIAVLFRAQCSKENLS